MSALNWKLSASCQRQQSNSSSCACPWPYFSFAFDLCATFYQLPDLKSVPSPRRLAHKILMRRICLIRRVVFPKFLNPAAKSFCFRVCIPATSCNYKRIMTFMTPDCLSVCVSVAVSVSVSQLCEHTLHITHVHRHAHTNTQCTARSFIK